MTDFHVERRVTGALYGRTAAEITGPLQPTGARVEYRPAYRRRDDWLLRSLGLLHVAVAVALGVFLLPPGNLPVLRR